MVHLALDLLGVPGRGLLQAPLVVVTKVAGGPDKLLLDVAAARVGWAVLALGEAESKLAGATGELEVGLRTHLFGLLVTPSLLG